jgi:hypothetical protein
MTGRVQSLRSSTAGSRPTGRQPGELYANFADAQLGVVNAANTAQDLIGVRFFSNATSYAIGDHVIQGGRIQRAIAVISPGPFTANQWSQVATMADVTGTYVPVSGGTMTGALILNANPVSALGAAPKQYVDSAVATYLPLAGGALSGNLSGPSGIFSGNLNAGALGITGNANIGGSLGVPGGQIVIPPGPAGGVNPVIFMTDGSTNRLVLYFNVATGQTTLVDVYSSANITMGPANEIDLNAGTVAVASTLSVGTVINIPNNGSNIAMYGTCNVYSDTGSWGFGESADIRTGTSWRYIFDKASGTRLWYDSNSRAVMVCDPAGNLSISGVLGQGSDVDLKRDITDAPDGIEQVRLMRPRRYHRTIHDDPPADVTWSVPDREELGFVAQEMQEALPHAVRDHDENTLAIELMPLIATLVNAVKDLDARLEAIENSSPTSITVTKGR